MLHHALELNTVKLTVTYEPFIVTIQAVSQITNSAIDAVSCIKNCIYLHFQLRLCLHICHYVSLC